MLTLFIDIWMAAIFSMHFTREFAFKLGILKYIFITEKAVLDMFLVAFICMYVCLSEM